MGNFNRYYRYKVYRKYSSTDGVNFDPTDEYQVIDLSNGVDEDCAYGTVRYNCWNGISEDCIFFYDIDGNRLNIVYNDKGFLETDGEIYTVNSTEGIGDGCFSWITFPSSVHQLSGPLFRGCGGLKEFVIGKNINQLDDYVFDTPSLTSITFEEGSEIKYINKAFASQSGQKTLDELILPDSVLKISEDAFRNTRINKLVLDKNCSTIEENGLRYAYINEIEFKYEGNINPLNITSTSKAIVPSMTYGYDWLDLYCGIEISYANDDGSERYMYVYDKDDNLFTDNNKNNRLDYFKIVTKGYGSMTIGLYSESGYARKTMGDLFSDNHKKEIKYDGYTLIPYGLGNRKWIVQIIIDDKDKETEVVFENPSGLFFNYLRFNEDKVNKTFNG